MNEIPLVSFVIPVFNEESYIKNCIDSIFSQEYPLEKIEVHVVDGNSTDRTIKIIQNEYINNNKSVYLHNNPRKKTPLSLNIGIKAANGEIIVILGAHTTILKNFITLNVKHLRKPSVNCSGGTQINIGTTALQSSIGSAMGHWFGLPSATYRYSKNAGYVKTVVYGAYKKEIFNKIGYFEEEGIISEDSEFNFRITQAGYKIHFDPQIKTEYYPRKNYILLAKQMYNYGIMKSQVWRKHAGGLSILHILAPIGLVLMIILIFSSIFFKIAGIIALTLLVPYLMIALLSSITMKERSTNSRTLYIYIAFILIHISWSIGFLMGFLKPKFNFRQFIRKT